MIYAYLKYCDLQEIHVKDFFKTFTLKGSYTFVFFFQAIPVVNAFIREAMFGLFCPFVLLMNLSDTFSIIAMMNFSIVCHKAIVKDSGNFLGCNNGT